MKISLCQKRKRIAELFISSLFHSNRSYQLGCRDYLASIRNVLSKPLSMVARRQFNTHLNGNTVFSFLVKSRRCRPSEPTRVFTEGFLFFRLRKVRFLWVFEVSKEARKNMGNSRVMLKYSSTADTPDQFTISGFCVSCKAFRMRSSIPQSCGKTCSTSSIKSRIHLSVSVSMTAWGLVPFNEAFSKTVREQ